MARTRVKGRKLRRHTAEEARAVQPPGGDPGWIEEPPSPLLYFWVRTEGEPNAYTPEGTKLYHVGASSAGEARARVEEIEAVNATGIGGHGGPPWKPVSIKSASRHVDPSGDSDALYGP